MRKEVCVKCGRAMRIISIGAKALEYQDEEKKHPYKLWSCDISECRDCGYRVIARWGDKPFSEHFEDDFEKEVEKARKAGTEFDAAFVEFY